jgi:protein-S-isoprenylcysteine O-methyltransferase Ste14
MNRSYVRLRHFQLHHNRVVSAWRHIRAIALLPGLAAVAVPAAILVSSGTEVGWGLRSIAAALTVLIGLALICSGFAVWVWTVRLLATVGRGTLAPWDPTSHLVAVGPYRRLRNPMITAVLAVLAGEGVLFGSVSLLIWAAIFLVVNHLFFLLYEEPAMERRFGEEYRAYAREVPRWLPRRSQARTSAASRSGGKTG